MNFCDCLKNLRRSHGLSQEKLAEKLSVSRQAVTKWEAGTGYPETESLIAIADLFGITVDELLRPNERYKAQKEFIYKSVTQYDVDRKKRFDIKLGCVRQVTLGCNGGEKLTVTLASDSIESINTDLKIKIDDIKTKTDVDLCRLNNLTKTRTQNELDVIIGLPSSLSAKIELGVNADRVEIRDTEYIEFDGKAKTLLLENTKKAELNCGCDADISCINFSSVEVNQISCTSRLKVTDGTVFDAVKKGMGNSIYFESGGKYCEAFSTKGAERKIELNGIKTELIIYKL